MPEAIDRCRAAITSRKPLNIGVVNVAKIVKLQRDLEIRQSILDSDIVLADGAPLVWASRVLRQSLPERVAGIDLFEEILRVANQERWSVYLLGAKTEVLEGVCSRVARELPGVRIAGARNGYFDPSEFDTVADEIVASSPDVLFVAITSPKKEAFLHHIGGRGGVPVTHGVGGSFDVYSGATKRAPRWMQRTGLEWAYRIAQEPRRMWRRYAVTNTLFVFLLLRNLLSPQAPLTKGTT